MAHLLVVDNEIRMCKLLKTSLEMESHSVDIFFSGQDACEQLDKKSYDIIVTDLKMEPVNGMQVLEFALQKNPNSCVILMTAFATQETALQAMKLGAYDYLIKPFKIDELSLRIERILRQKSLEEENSRLKKVSSLPDTFPGIIGKSKKMRKVFKLIEQVSANDVAVLIRGESGTGKELVAHAIHTNSPRKNHPFLAINCAALPENLLESELFGYEKGAFTGAQKQKPGQFENAHQGTLFLDEIGDLSMSLQAKLLRVLQNNEITRLGGKDPIHIDVRLITATHCNLEEMIDDSLFRSDLFYRINIVPVFLPPLRERKEDIPELIQFFMRRFPDKEISSNAKRLLMEYEFPGNVRELENIISREGIISEHVIDQIDLPHFKKSGISPDQQSWKLPEEGINLDEVERLLINQALSMAQGNKSRAAQLLGITRRKLYSMMKRFGIDI